MPVYNADGSLNANRSIEGYMELQMTIRDHVERIELAVTNLGNMDIFLGLDWLHFHNPTIDWSELLVTFDRCPDKCGYNLWWLTPEEQSISRLLEGDRLFIFDWEGYVTNTSHLCTVKTLNNAADYYVQQFLSVFNKQGFDSLPD